MSKSVKIIGLMIVLMAGAVAVFHQSITSYLFAPEGLSLAAAEVCLINKTGQNLVVNVSVEGGEQMTSLLFPDEKGCAASPEASRSGTVKVSLKDNVGPFCVKDVQSGDTSIIDLFDPETNCGWAN